VPAIEAAFASIEPVRDGAVAVIGDLRLARALAAGGRAIAVSGLGPRDARAVRRLPPEVTVVDELPERHFAAVVGSGAGSRPDWEQVLAAWSRAVVDGGGLVLVDRAAAVELSRRALCHGLSELEQRVAGRWIVTSGLVSDL